MLVKVQLGIGIYPYETAHEEWEDNINLHVHFLICA